MLLITFCVLQVPAEVDLDGCHSSLGGQGYDYGSTLMGNVHINIAKASQEHNLGREGEAQGTLLKALLLKPSLSLLTAPGWHPVLSTV